MPRSIVERLSECGITTFVLHDFDKTGFTILQTLQENTRRYEFQTKPRVVDLGLRLDDVRKLDLQSEDVFYKSKIDPRVNLAACGAIPEECNFLVQRKAGNGWEGERVELNALMSAGRFLDWLERKLLAHGVQKVAPDASTLEAAYKRAWKRAIVQDAIDRAIKEMDMVELDVPDDLEETIRSEIEDTTTPWDDALWEIVRKHRQTT